MYDDDDDKNSYIAQPSVVKCGQKRSQMWSNAMGNLSPYHVPMIQHVDLLGDFVLCLL